MFDFDLRKVILLLFIFCATLNAQTNRESVKVRLKATLDTGKAESFDFINNDKEIKVILKDKTQIWNTETGKLLRIEENAIVPQEPSGSDVVSYGWGKKFRVLRLKKAKGETENRIVIWDREKNEISAELKGFSQKIVRVFWSEYERKLLTISKPQKSSFFASPQTELIVWDTITGRLENRLVLEYLNEYSKPLMSPDGRKLVTRQTNPLKRKTSVKVWDAETGKLLYEPAVPPRKTADGKDIDVSGALVYEAKFTADGKFLLGTTGDAAFFNTSDGNLVAWNAENGEVVWQTPDTSKDSERYLGFKLSDDEKILVAVKEFNLSLLKKEKIAEIRDVETGKLLATLKNPEPGKNEIAFHGGYETGYNLIFSPSAKTLITGGRSKAEVWNVSTGYRRCTFPRAWEPADCFFCLSNTDYCQFRASEKIIVASNNDYLRIWNTENCKLIQRFDSRAVWSRDDRLILLIAKDKKSVQLWEVILN